MLDAAQLETGPDRAAPLPKRAEFSRVLVTGASGFIGRHVCHLLRERGLTVFAAVRHPDHAPPGTTPRLIADLRGSIDWSGLCDDVDTVIHLAGYVHAGPGTPDRLAVARSSNTIATRALAEEAVAAGVRRFVFASTVKVFGDGEGAGSDSGPLSDATPPLPVDAYGQSKLEAEQALREIASRSPALSVVVLRLPLTYGPDVKANVLRLLSVADSPWPLPLGSARAPRSMLAVSNAADAFLRAAEVERTGFDTFVLCDGQDLTVRDLLLGLRRRLNRRGNLLPIPLAVLRLTAATLGLSTMVNRLIEPLRINDARFRAAFDWHPPVTPDQELSAMADWYRQSSKRRENDRRRRIAMPKLSLDAGIAPVSAVIVSYRTGPALFDCLDAALKETALAEVILVDNGNSEADMARLRDLAAQTPRLRLVSGHGNVGFAAGCNIGVSLAANPLVLLLNPDCILEPDVLPPLKAAVGRRYGHWAATVRLLDQSGTEQRGSRRNIGSPLQFFIEGLGLARLMPGLFNRWRLNFHTLPVPRGLTPVPAISGAFMLMPRETFFALNGMDEGYFLHVEDLDFCLRLNRLGGTLLFLGSRACTHIKSTSDAPSLMVELHKIRGLKRFFVEHFGPAYPRLGIEAIWTILATGIFVRAVYRRLLRG